MRINDALMREVFRRAEVSRDQQLQRSKLLLGLRCVVLSLALLFLLGKTGMTVASVPNPTVRLCLRAAEPLRNHALSGFFFPGVPGWP